MNGWLGENLGTILVSLILVALVVLTIRSLVKKKKNGGGCSCGCSGCPSSSFCHKK